MNEHLPKGRPTAVCQRCGGLLFALTARASLEGKEYHYYCKYKEEQKQLEQSQPKVVMAVVTGNGDPT